jgi:tetratricopeptide (TPR) repeat protein
MPEPRRFDAAPLPDGRVDRDSQVETLLVEGLDQYFANRYEDAIHLWTRVLFLDRSHARARAYIDRARTTLAERQRRSEEMLHVGQHLLDHGDPGAARSLLTQAVATAGDDERAAALRWKLERHERAHAMPQPSRLPIVAAPDVIPGWVWSPWSPAVVVIAAALAAGLLLVVSVTSTGLREWMGFGAANEVLMSARTPARIPVLSSSDVALVRARTLYARGRLAQALQALDRVAENSPVRAEADALRVEIQRLLLASGQERSSAARGTVGSGR